MRVTTGSLEQVVSKCKSATFSKVGELECFYRDSTVLPVSLPNIWIVINTLPDTQLDDEYGESGPLVSYSFIQLRHVNIAAKVPRL